MLLEMKVERQQRLRAPVPEPATAEKRFVPEPPEETRQRERTGV
jgi:hypothetical protein